LAVHRDHGVSCARHQAVVRGALSPTFGGLRCTFDPQHLESGIEVTVGLGQGLLGVHHAGTSGVAELFDVCGGEVGHVVVHLLERRTGMSRSGTGHVGTGQDWVRAGSFCVGALGSVMPAPLDWASSGSAAPAATSATGVCSASVGSGSSALVSLSPTA